MEVFLNLFTYFMIYSFLGWVCEIVWCSVTEKKVVKDRGFLFGPYCPIYGLGALMIIYSFGRYKEDLLALFLVSMVACSILEFVTSYLFEKIFNERWWDYSNEKFNIEGRVCLLNSTAFGVLAVLLINFLHPFFTAVVNIIPTTTHIVICSVLLTIFVLDLYATLAGLLKLRNIMKLINKNRNKRFIFRKGIFKYSDELFSKISKFHYLNIRYLLKRFPKLSDPRDKDLGKILKNITKKKK